MQTPRPLMTAECRLDSATGTVGPAGSVYRNQGAMTVILKRCPNKDHVVHAKGPLRMPVSRTLRHSVRDLLRRGERRIVVDLSAVSRIDASGVGELIRAFNMTAAVNGALRIVNTTAWVREMLARAGLCELLSVERAAEQWFA